MDKFTKKYREAELSEINLNPTYKASIKIIAGDGKATKWLMITNVELVKLKKLLSGRRK